MLKATIGGFDGVHLAHQELIKKADIVIIIEKGSSLTPGLDRIEYIKKPFEFLFLDDIKDLSALEFVNYLKNLNITSIIVGEDFKFAKNRSGDINYLKKFFDVEVIKEIKYQNIAIHARNIRKLIQNGEIKLANTLLGKDYKLKGIQIKGQGLGKKKLLPTINIELFKPYTIPKSGVYLTKTNSYKSLTFIGYRSTDNQFSIETHILEDFEKSKFYQIEFIDFFRENKKFTSLEELKKQLEFDLQKAKELFS